MEPTHSPNPSNKSDIKDRENLGEALEYWREPRQIIKARVGSTNVTI